MFLFFCLCYNAAETKTSPNLTFSQMKKFIAPALALLFVAGIFAFDITVFAQGASPLIDVTDSPDNITQSTTFGGSFREAIKTIVNYFLFFLGIVATVMVIYGGFMYVTSQGDDSQVEKGKNILIYAAIGKKLTILPRWA